MFQTNCAHKAYFPPRNFITPEKGSIAIGVDTPLVIETTESPLYDMTKIYVVQIPLSESSNYFSSIDDGMLIGCPDNLITDPIEKWNKEYVEILEAKKQYSYEYLPSKKSDPNIFEWEYGHIVFVMTKIPIFNDEKTLFKTNVIDWFVTEKAPNSVSVLIEKDEKFIDLDFLDLVNVTFRYDAEVRVEFGSNRKISRSVGGNPYFFFKRGNNEIKVEVTDDENIATNRSLNNEPVAYWEDRKSFSYNLSDFKLNPEEIATIEIHTLDPSGDVIFDMENTDLSDNNILTKSDGSLLPSKSVISGSLIDYFLNKDIKIDCFPQIAYTAPKAYYVRIVVA